MEIFKIIAIAVCTLVATLIIKQIKPEFSAIIGLSGGVLILLIIINLVGDVFLNFNQILSKTGVPNDIFKMLLKVVGIGYLSQFTGNLCSDFGNGAIADYVFLGGRVLILILCFPIFKTLLDLVVGLI